MAVPLTVSNPLRPPREFRALLIKWGVAFLVPLLIFTFVWQGDSTINNIVLGLINPQVAIASTSAEIQSAVFMVIFYVLLLGFGAYMVAADSGRRKASEIWIDVGVFVAVPIIFIDLTNSLVLGVAVSAIVWGIYFFLRSKVSFLKPDPPIRETPPAISDAELRARAVTAGLWLSVVLAVIWIVADAIFYLTGPFPTALLILIPVRTILFIGSGYGMGLLAGWIATLYTPDVYARKNAAREAKGKKLLKPGNNQLVPTDTPFRGSGARIFYLVLLIALLVFYPALDRFFFGFGTDGRLTGYGDAGYYVILALGLNIVVGFAGLLDLGYVAFFAIGAYTWAIVGSSQLGQLTGIFFSPLVESGIFWPMLLGAALVAAVFGVLLGLPTLRLRGDYLAIVTLGFGEIVPIVAQNLNQITNGPNGLVGIQSPGFFGITWSVVTPAPYYYLILALIAITIFSTIRLRDSRMGRAWVALREDEIAAASSGINLRNTKLLAFAAGAFFSGVAGAYHSAKLGIISPDIFSYGDSVIYLAMVVIGGIGSIPGVIVGAIAVYSIDVLILGQLDALATDPTSFIYPIDHVIVQVIPGFTFGNIRNLIFGTILILVMIFRPEGLIPSARRKRELHEAQEIAEPGAMDIAPSDPAFEAEVRVD